MSAQRLSSATITERLRVIRMFYQDTEIQPLQAQPLDIARWLASHDEWSDSTVAVYTTILAAWFKWLVLVDRRLDNPMAKVGRAKTPERLPRPIADDDVPKLLKTRMWSTTRAMILLALLAGLRVHEIAKIRGEDIDLGARLLWVKGKGRKLRSLPLHPLLVEIAADMPERGWWFPMRGYEAEHVLPRSVSDIVRLTMRRAGVPGSAHSLRHWYATSLLDDGADLRVVQELLRHKSLATTQIYTKVSNHRQREAIDGLSLARHLRSRGPDRGAVLR
jgi:site-specific recombinase XerD